MSSMNRSLSGIQIEHEDEHLSSADEERTSAHRTELKQDRLLAQLSTQLAALQQAQSEAASAADVRSLHNQGAPMLMLLNRSQCSGSQLLWHADELMMHTVTQPQPAKSR